MSTRIWPHTHLVKLVDRPQTHAADMRQGFFHTPCGQHWHYHWYRVEVVGFSKDEPTCKTCRRRLGYEN